MILMRIHLFHQILSNLVPTVLLSQLPVVTGENTIRNITVTGHNETDLE